MATKDLTAQNLKNHKNHSFWKESTCFSCLCNLLRCAWLYLSSEAQCVKRISQTREEFPWLIVLESPGGGGVTLCEQAHNYCTSWFTWELEITKFPCSCGPLRQRHKLNSAPRLESSGFQADSCVFESELLGFWPQTFRRQSNSRKCPELLGRLCSYRISGYIWPGPET